MRARTSSPSPKNEPSPLCRLNPFQRSSAVFDEAFGAECFDLRKNMAVIQTPIAAPGELGLSMGVKIGSGFFFGVHRSFLPLRKTVMGGRIIKWASFFQLRDRVDVPEGALWIVGKTIVRSKYITDLIRMLYKGLMFLCLSVQASCKTACAAAAFHPALSSNAGT